MNSSIHSILNLIGALLQVWKKRMTGPAAVFPLALSRLRSTILRNPVGV